MAIPLLIAAAAAGTGAAFYNKYTENQKAQKQINIAKDEYYNKKIINERQFFLGKKQIQAQMLSQTLTTEDQLRDIALQVFHQKSAANAAAGASGVGDGTVYSNIKLMTDILRMKANAAKQTSIANLDATQINAELNKLNYDSGVLELNSYMDKIQAAQEDLDWNTSIFSYAMAGISGALSGMAMYNNVDALMLKNGINLDKIYENVTQKVGSFLDKTFKNISQYISEIRIKPFIGQYEQPYKEEVSLDIPSLVNIQQSYVPSMVNSSGFFNNPLKINLNNPLGVSNGIFGGL